MSTEATQALATVKGLSGLIMRGRTLDARIGEFLTSAQVVLPIDGAPTLSLGVSDPRRILLNSGLLTQRFLLNVDTYPFELVQVAKSGASLTLTLEHEVVAALRRHTSPLKVAPGKMTHLTFAHRIVSEEKWVQFHGPTGIKVPVAKTELSRGMPNNQSSDGGKESTWDALARMAGERGWRRFVRGNSQLWYVPDEFLFAQPSRLTLTPGKGGVDDIDFDFDEGKPVSSATVTCRSAAWQVPPGLTVDVTECGPANGKWLVSEVNRELTSISTSVVLSKPQAALPEPAPDSKAGSTRAGTSGAGGGTSSGSGPTAKDFVNKALTESGKAYVWGAEGPTSFDCSGLVQFIAQELGLTAVPRVSGEQYSYCRKHNSLISIARAEHVRGALLFMGVAGVQHVAISLGDGRTIEARGKAYGVGSFSASGRNWSAAALLPGLRY